jgi:hypothetical protein
MFACSIPGMSTIQLSSPSIGAIQNSLAGALFFLLFATQLAAYLLYLYPSVELFWMLSVPMNRIASPFLYIFDDWTGLGAPASLAILGAAAVFPLIAQLRKNWLFTSCAGHTALAVGTVLTIGAIRRAGASKNSADLTSAFDPAMLDMNSATLTLATATLVGLCTINHIVFFRRIR